MAWDFDKRVDLSTLFLRLGTGVLFLWMGFLKFKMPPMREMLSGLVAKTFVGGLAPTFVNTLMVFELVVGVLLIIGLWTRVAGALIALLMLGTLFVLNWHMPPEMMGPWGAFMLKDFAILGSSLALALLGSERWSVDGWWQNRAR